MNKTLGSTGRQRYSVPIIATIIAVGLTGCASQSEQHIRFFKPSSPAQVEPRYLSMDIVTVSQPGETVRSARPAGGRP